MVFGAYVAVAWFVLVFGHGSRRWFFRDDWAFLAGRDGGDIDGLFAPHGEHLSFLPIAIFRVMFNLFGLRFTPYLVLVVTMHLVVATLLRVVMRRAGVHPWVATAAAAMMVLFGPGEENIVWAFQVGFMGAILWGLVHLVLADHRGPIGRRDGLALGAGALSVLSAGTGTLLVAIVGATVLATRGWRAAALHTVPLGVLYLLWFWWQDPRSASAFGNPSAGQVVGWVRSGERGAFEAVGQYLPVTLAIVAVLVVGLVIGAVDESFAELRRRWAAPVVMLLGGPAFYAMISFGRWIFGTEAATLSRYVYVGALLALPAIAIAADAITRRWPLAAPALVALLLVPVPGQAGGFGESAFTDEFFEREEQRFLGVARHPDAPLVDPAIRPMPDFVYGPAVTLGWFLQVRADGRLPEPPPLSAAMDAELRLRLGLAHAGEPVADPDCAAVDDLTVVTPDVGDRFALPGPIRAVLVTADGVRSNPVVYRPGGGPTLVVGLPDMTIEFTSPPGQAQFQLCPEGDAGT